MKTNGPVLLFDGVCNLCTGSVQFILKRDRSRKLKFASLQSEFGIAMLQSLHLPEDHASSLVLIEHGKVYVKSDAALRVSKHLNGMWPIFSVFLIVPSFIINYVYDIVGRNRYKWFGKKDECWMPDPEVEARFIE